MIAQTFQPTDQQADIIRTDGSAFIQACPGAGKTRVMVERARHLFADLPVGRGVAFLSFTRGAVSELENRLTDIGLLRSSIFPSFIGTFDSFVWQFLVAPFGIRGCAAKPQLIADISEFLVTPFQGAHPLPLSCFEKETHAIDAAAAKQRGFDVATKAGHQMQAYETAARNIRAGLSERGHLDFDQARTEALSRLNDAVFSKRLAAALAGRFHEVIVDEAQDCNPDDLAIIDWLRASGLPVKVVCDPHQSIYAFRGGVTDHLFKFAETFPEKERKRLTGNFRASGHICKAIVRFRPIAGRGHPDDALGCFKDEVTPVHVLSYSGTSVPASIGAQFAELLKTHDIKPSDAPVLASTRASAAAAIGQPPPSRRRERAVRLAQAVTGYQFASGFSELREALESIHEILLDVEGRLDGTTYHRYVADSGIEAAAWRPDVASLAAELRFNTGKHGDAKGWHAAAKSAFAARLSLPEGQSLAQKLKWNDAIADSLASAPVGAARPRTIHSVKGLEFPAVCVVTTAATLKSLLDFLETGSPVDRAEDARKLYVAASRAQRLLVVAAPKSQAQRLATHLGSDGAAVVLADI